eukprot:1632597-Pleurochrysis_carterae.AAC.1
MNLLHQMSCRLGASSLLVIHAGRCVCAVAAQVQSNYLGWALGSLLPLCVDSVESMRSFCFYQARAHVAATADPRPRA